MMYAFMSLHNFITQHHTRYFYYIIFASFKIAPINRNIKQHINNTLIYHQEISRNNETEPKSSIKKA